MAIVVFRKENEKLASACMKKFKNKTEAKKFIEEDAVHFLTKHPGISLGWIKPKSLDYYMVTLKNGVNCYWQYFEL